MELTNFDLKYNAIRQSIIDNVFSHLNEMQQKAVLHTEGPLLILAGAGSGKTTVLIHRIINILRFGKTTGHEQAPQHITSEDMLFLAQYLTNPKPENDQKAWKLCAVEPAKPWEIIAITFTNKAATELRDRLTHAVGVDDASLIWACTFHSACLRILRYNIERLGYEKTFTIYDEDDKKRVIVDLLRRLNLDEKVFDPRSIMSAISHAKDNLVTPAKYALEAEGDFYKGKISEIYVLYQKTLKEANALDFDDIIVKTVELLQNNSDVLEYYQRKFRYVLVDEYQDTNHAQYVLTSLLAGGHQNICVVGDDDQSIYKFRGATITNILEFEKQYFDTCVIRLEQNYRSTDTILCAANEIIRHNSFRKGKELWTETAGGAKIRVHRSDTQESEASYIADCIIEGVAQGGEWSDFAVLYRNNVLSNNIEGAFRRNSIPYRIYKGRDFFSRAEIRDMFAYLWVIENPSDHLRLKRIINTPSRKIGERSVELAEQVAIEQGTDLFNIVCHASEHPSLSRAAAAMEKFGAIIGELQKQKDLLTLPELYDQLLIQSGYITALEAKDDLESHGRAENIMELKSNIVDYQERTETPTLSGFLEEMALYTDADQSNEEEDCVLLMTMHSAKGLEFQSVFLCGMEDGLFPSFRSEMQEEELEEERRLCYVAVTRAKKQLFITCAERRMIYGRTQYSRPSRFIDEIPQNLLDSNISQRQTYTAVSEQSKPTESLSLGIAYRSSVVSPTINSSDMPLWKAGDRVQHKAFGKGMVVSVKLIGNNQLGDQLLEIVFDLKGTKRLMAKSAAQFMHKI